jgi:hypothetical protein
MKALLLLPLLLSFTPQQRDPADARAPLAVLAFKWAKSRQAPAQQEPAGTGPAPTITRAHTNFERNARVNDPPEARDPTTETPDGRAAIIEKNVQESRRPALKPVDGFAYRVKVRNDGPKAVEVIFWEYRSAEAANPAAAARRQFLCGAQIKPGRDKELQIFSTAAPAAVVSAGGTTDKPGELPADAVVINRVEYADGTIWQRAGWSFAEVKSAVARATATPWGAETCRGL